MKLGTKPRCTCTLQDGPAETVVAELHDEDCALYLWAMELEERFKTVGLAILDQVAAGAEAGLWTAEERK